MNNGIQKIQITKIHIAKSNLKISDADYRAMLSGFKNAEGSPCTSSKEFTEKQANVFLDLLKRKLGWQEKRKNKNLKYEDLVARDSKFASPAQLRKIEALWNIHSREKTEASLIHFISRILKVDLITSVLKKDVNRLLKAIQSLKNSPPQGSIPSPYKGEGRGEVGEVEQ